MNEGSLRIGPMSFNTAILFWESISPLVWIKILLFSILVKKLDNTSNTVKKIEIEDKIAKTLMSIKIDGLIATNTTSNHQSAHGKGGISGKPLFKKSTRVLKLMRSLLGKEFPIIASGGVTDLKTYKEKINSGANLVQIYTGIIYKGPKLIQEILAAEQD